MDARGTPVAVGPPEVDPPTAAGRDPEADAALDRIVEEGAPRLLRTWPVTVVTGLVAGMEVGLGVLALLDVKQATGSQALAGLAFSVGFIALLLGRSELFTEGFLTPVAVVVARRARVVDALKLWLGILAGNLAGGMVIAWFAMRGFPQLHAEARRSAAYFVAEGWSLRTVSLAVLAGTGGVAFTTILRLLQSRRRLGEHRDAAARAAPAGGRREAGR